MMITQVGPAMSRRAGLGDAAPIERISGVKFR